MGALISDGNDSELLRHPGTFVEQRTNTALYGLIFVIMVSVGRIQEVIPGLQALKLGKVAFGLLFILYFVSPKRNDIQVFSSSQMKYVLALFLLGLVSTLFSVWPGESMHFMLFNFLYSVVLIFMLIKIATTLADMKKIVWGIVISLVVLGVIALLSRSERVSSGGGSYDANDLAFVMVLFLPLFYFSMKNELGVRRLFLAFALIISLATITATQSRGGFLGLLTVFFAISLLERVNLGKMIAGGFIILLLIMVIAPAGFGERMSSILKPNEDYNMSEEGGRITIWRRGIQLMMANPLLGVGPSVYAVAEGALHTDISTGLSGKWSAAHNSFIQVGAEFGIPGLVLFIMILVKSIRSLRKLRRELPEDAEMRWLVNALEVGFYGYIVSGFFLSQAYSAAFFLLVGLTVAVINMTEGVRTTSVRLNGDLS